MTLKTKSYIFLADLIFTILIKKNIFIIFIKIFINQKKFKKIKLLKK